MAYSLLAVGLSLICSKMYVLFLPEFNKIFTYYSFFIPIASPIIPLYSTVSIIISQCRSDYILSALADYVY